MSNYPEELKYSKEHEWVRINGKEVTIGITDYAAEQLGDVVFVEIPKVGTEYKQDAAFGVVESVKSVSDIYVPVAGKVTAVNQSLIDQPALINEDPYQKGWIARFEIQDPSQLNHLLSAKQYDQFLSEEA